MADMAKFRAEEDDLKKYGRPDMPPTAVPAPVGSRPLALGTAGAPTEMPWEKPVRRLGENAKRNIAAIGDFLAADRTEATRQGIRNMRQTGREVLGDARQAMLGAVDAAPQPPSAGIRQAAVPVAPTLVNFEDSPQARGTGFRTTRIGDRTVLTNVSDAAAEFGLQGGDYVDGLTASGGFRNVSRGQMEALGLVPGATPGGIRTATRNRFYNAGDFTPSTTGDASLNALGAAMASGAAQRRQRTYDNLIAQGYSPAEAEDQTLLEEQANSGEARQVRNTVALRGLRDVRNNARAAAETSRMNAEAAQANAVIAGVKAQAELARISKDLGVNLKAKTESRLIDPEQPYLGTVETVTGFVSTDGNVPVNIPIEDYQSYQRARRRALDEGDAERLALIDRSFREEFQLGG